MDTEKPRVSCRMKLRGFLKIRKEKMANILTCMRIMCGVILIFCEPFSAWFDLVYIFGGVTDVFDGIAARHFGKETRLGAQLDTIADFVFAAVVIMKVARTVYVPEWLMIWIICIAIIKIINVISGFVVVKRFVSEHTAMNKVCGILLFAIPLCIDRFPRQAVTVLVILTCMIATAAAIQEGFLIRSGKEVK